MAFNYDFCVRVRAHPQGSPNNSKQIDIDDYHPLLRSLTDRLSLYGAFPEPHFNTHRLDILEKLSEYLDLNFNWSDMTITHLAYPDLALDNFSGTDPDQHAELFIQFIERKIDFALGDAPADADELLTTPPGRKPSSSLLRGPAAEWYENNIIMLLPGKMSKQTLSLDSHSDETSFATEW